MPAEIAELKSQLSKYLRAVEQGAEIEVKPARWPVDVVELLLEDRRKRWLGEWRRARRSLASELIRLECLRKLDRARIRLGLPDEEIARRRSGLLEAFEAFDLIRVDRNSLARAAEPFPTVLGTLDALHLSSALAIRPQVRDLVFATHDRELALAASAMGFAVVGSSLTN